MKTITIIMLIIAGLSSKEKSTSLVAENFNNETNYYCYWEDTNSYHVSSRRGGYGGSRTSLTVYYRNGSEFTKRVAFYLADENGNLPNRPPNIIYTIEPGQTKSASVTYSNGRFRVLVARENEKCDFPILN